MGYEDASKVVVKNGDHQTLHALYPGGIYS